MLDEVLNERIEMLAKVREEIKGYRTYLANMEEFERELVAQVEQLGNVRAKDHEPKFAGMVQRYRRAMQTERAHAAEQERRPRVIRDTAYQVLKQNPEPIWVHYSDLMKQVQAKGVQIGGQRPDDNFMNHLTQDERFIRSNGRAMWSLKEWFPDHDHDEAKQNGVTIGS